MKTNVIPWLAFRRLPGLIGATLDFQIDGLPNHPNPVCWKTAHLRGEITKIAWGYRRRKNVPSCIYLRNVHRYLPGKRSWQKDEERGRLEYCAWCFDPTERNGRYSFCTAANCRVTLVPKGVRVPLSKHLLYLTQAEREERERQTEEFIEKLFPST